MDYTQRGRYFKYFIAPPAQNKEMCLLFGDSLVDVCNEKIIELNTRYDQLDHLKRLFRFLLFSYKDQIHPDIVNFLEMMEVISADSEQKVIKKWIKYWYIAKRKAQKLPLIVKGVITDDDIATARTYPFQDMFIGKLRGHNGKLVGICPFHKEKTPSFTIFTKDNHAHCFGCGWQGSIIDYVMQTQELGFVEAIKQLV